MRVTTARVPVSAEGACTIQVDLPILTDADGEQYVTLDDALRWERWQEFVALTRQGSSRLPRRQRRLFGNAGSQSGIAVWDSTLASVRTGSSRSS